MLNIICIQKVNLLDYVKHHIIILYNVYCNTIVI